MTEILIVSTPNDHTTIMSLTYKSSSRYLLKMKSLDVKTQMPAISQVLIFI